jgi:hypothetical protein
MADDRFEDRLRALARQLSQSISETDLDEVADRLGVDRDRIRGAAGAVEGWLSDRAAPAEPLFDDDRPPRAPASDPRSDQVAQRSSARGGAGPHPLDLPGDEQGRALSALSSGRWTVRPGSGRLVSAERPTALTAFPPPPDDADLIGELRARDWITADGTVTLVGRQALLRWCRTADSPTTPGDGDAAGDGPQ